jgi:hypothetical protein
MKNKAGKMKIHVVLKTGLAYILRMVFLLVIWIINTWMMYKGQRLSREAPA